MTTPRLLAFGLLLAICPSAFAARDHVPLEQRLTPEQMKATGLDQLTTEQLRLLNRLLDEDRKAVAEEVRKERGNDGPRVTGTLFGGDGLEPVTSTLTGNLRGWSRGTVFVLENGQRWRVIDGEYYASKPLGNARVVVSPGKISGWYLQVDGHNPRPKVQRAD
ncbi:hypothetical protein [Pseudoxanthomonas sp.]|jgi:hypothetical protein|uniref:hypothetical protein n=1 Tax=Pseudoxanthomonas sp. TaxID=1871049 RepID=UPI002E0E8A10|nr:hypothetical protein [Pseudoxanthomonas sp.]